MPPQKALMDDTTVICSNEAKTRQMLEHLVSLIIMSWCMMHFKSKKSCNLSVPFRCSLSDTMLDTMVLHSSLLVAISAHLFMSIPTYRETFPSHPHLFLSRPRLPFTMPSVIIRCRLSCLLTCPTNLSILCRTTVINLVDCSPSLFSTSLLVFFAFHETCPILLYIHISRPLRFISFVCINDHVSQP